MQPGKVKKGDILFLLSAVVVIGITFLTVWLVVR